MSVNFNLSSTDFTSISSTTAPTSSSSSLSRSPSALEAVSTTGALVAANAQRREGSLETREIILDLSDSGLISFIPRLSQMDGVTCLNLAGNQLTELAQQTIDQFTNLQTLYLENNRFTVLPPGICQLTNLQELCLDGNLLTELPPEIGQLTNLNRLTASDCALIEIPNELGQCKELEYLFVDGNTLETIPDSITKLPKLSELDVSRNMLTTLPREIGLLQNLDEFRFGDNQLEILPASFRELPEDCYDHDDIEGLPYDEEMPIDVENNAPSSTPESQHNQNLKRTGLDIYLRAAKKPRGG